MENITLATGSLESVILTTVSTAFILIALYSTYRIAKGIVNIILIKLKLNKEEAK